MAKFIAISGPSSTGKTTLVNSLSTHRELSNAVFSPDLYDTVWTNLVDQGLFSEWKEINTDSEYLCLYVIRLIDYYENYIKSYEDTDKLVILDGCWLDLAIYAIINIWYTRIIKEVQEEILHRLNRFDKHLSRIYFTSFDESKQLKQRYRMQYRMANMKLNRPLEIQFYELYKNFRNAVTLPSSDISESSLFIIDDLSKLGYL